MTILFISEDGNAQRWLDAVTRHLEGFDAKKDFRIWPDDGGNPAAVDIALVRLPRPGVLAAYPNLKAVLNLGAGVDDLLADPAFPRRVPLGRMVDDSLTQGHGRIHRPRGSSFLPRLSGLRPPPGRTPLATA